MTQKMSLMVLAGAALGLSSAVSAQQVSEDLKSDASSRSSFQGTNGQSMLQFSGYTQFQYNLNWRDDGDKNTAFVGDDALTAGFRFANTKLVAKGNITDEWSYKLQARFATSGGAFTLDDMYGQYTMDNGWNVQFGQKKLPFLHEELVADTGQQGAERSVINQEYSIGRSQGIFLNYTAEQWRFMGAFSDGAGQPNTDTNNILGNNAPGQADFAFTGRGEFKWAGDWNRFDQFSSWSGNENAGMVGAAAHYQDGGETVGTTDVSNWGGTIDVTFQGSGWNVYGAAVYRQIEPPQGDDLQDIGLIAQGGWFVSDDWELFGRVTWVIPDDNDADGNPNNNANGVQDRDQFTSFTVGANWFITPRSQAARFTIELVYAPEETIASNGAINYPTGAFNNSSQTDSGILTDAEGGQWNLRGQLQLLF